MSDDEQSAPFARGEASRSDSRGFPVVGLGASAGGLEALERFFAHVPADSGMAFVVVTHQHPGHASLMPELLARHTSMPVGQVTEATPVAPDHVYVSAPGTELSIEGGTLQVAAVDARVTLQLPIDHFFRSLAQDQQERAVGIVLSGTGSDGTLGLKAIKGALGMVMVQTEASARYAGMPHSAIATDLVDYVLPVEELPAQLVAYARGLDLSAVGAEVLEPETPSASRERALREIFAVLRRQTSHDFSAYKPSTIRRRIERRMNVHHVVDLAGYLSLLHAHPAEVDLLFKELLIGVTSFFRDPEAFEDLAEALPRLLAPKSADYVVRAWVPGCSTGEEAYSVAILLRECMDRLGRQFDVQIFATDIDPAAIDAARAGVYPDGIAVDLTPERLARYFLREDGSFRVRKDIREMVVFAPQNLIDDPPFTKLDLLCCRNLLIYLDSPLQRRLLPIFHYALKPTGLLFLGSSESVGSAGGLFEPVSKKWKIFRRKEVAAGSYTVEFPASRPLTGAILADGVPPIVAKDRAGGVAALADRLLLKELVPPSVIVHERGEIVHIHGRTGMFLEPAPGPQSTVNLFNMARDGLQIDLAAGIRQAAGRDTEVVRRGVKVRTNGEAISVNLRVRQLVSPEPFEGLFLVSFELAPPPEAMRGQLLAGAGDSDREKELERELQYTRESHQSTIEELETTNEELKSTNEELQSTNEELQSANEELETSKEEMQSLNEELQTVNAELQDKVEELSRTNDDMKNLLDGTDIATIFLDNDLCIKRYTEQAKGLINLIPTDVGRPLSDLVSKLRYETLVEDAREVLRTLVFREVEVGGPGDTWYLMRILPYRTTENMIDGLVITFVDVTEVRGLEKSEGRLQRALRGSPTSIYGQDAQLRVAWAYGAVYGREPADALGRTDEELLGGGAAALIELKRKVLASGESERRQVRVPLGGLLRLHDLFVEPQVDAGAVVGITCVSTDVTPSGEG